MNNSIRLNFINHSPAFDYIIVPFSTFLKIGIGIKKPEQPQRSMFRFTLFYTFLYPLKMLMFNTLKSNIIDPGDILKIRKNLLEKKILMGSRGLEKNDAISILL
jgi:hypothetical protein